jgi:hypothetical protein
MAEQLPDLLTVEEAARVLRIGRTAAYGLARIWRETNGREGLPVVNLGRLLRVPRSALEAVTGAELTNPVHPSPAPPEAPTPPESRDSSGRPARSTSGERKTRRPPRSQALSGTQASLPF